MGSSISSIFCIVILSIFSSMLSSGNITVISQPRYVQSESIYDKYKFNNMEPH